MQALEGLRRSITTAEELQSVVKSMKGMAAANIRHLTAAVESLSEYSRSIELSLQVLFSEFPERLPAAADESVERLGAIVFGSDQGMCGRFNQQIADHAVEAIAGLNLRAEARTVVAVGGRVVPLVEMADIAVADRVAPATSLAGIGDLVQELLLRVQAWRLDEGIDRVVLYYNRSLGGASYRPHTAQLVPVELQWLRGLAAADWPGRGLPARTLPWADLLAAAVREHLFIALYRAAAESLASENASRLSSMQAAERNIDERLAELQMKFRHQRHKAITEELLDIAAGFEALGQP